MTIHNDGKQKEYGEGYRGEYGRSFCNGVTVLHPDYGVGYANQHRINDTKLYTYTSVCTTGKTVSM
jgi:hypothetical protein